MPTINNEILNTTLTLPDTELVNFGTPVIEQNLKTTSTVSLEGLETESKLSLLNELDNKQTTQKTYAFKTDLTDVKDRNDICLVITPFDHYKKISLYNYVTRRGYYDFDILRDGYYSYYLLFSDNKKEIKIPEYYGETDDYLDSNELLFKITQNKAREILNLNSNVFYIVREVSTTLGTGEEVVQERQQIFFGRWCSDTEYNKTVNQQVIDNLKKQVEDLTRENKALNMELMASTEKILELQNEIDRLSEYEKYKDMYDELVNQMNMAEEYEATDVTSATIINTTIDANEYVDELQGVVDDFLDTLQK